MFGLNFELYNIGRMLDLGRIRPHVDQALSKLGE